MPAEYQEEVGVLYRRLHPGENPQIGEYCECYRAFHHPTQTSHDRRIAMPAKSPTRYRPDFLTLVNHWNRQPQTGFSYYAE